MERALEYLKSFPMFGSPKGYKPGLERVLALLEGLDSPQEDLPVIHIAGTNGKGSTARILSSILKAAGIKNGLYTSPELNSFTERIQIDEEEISLVELEEEVELIRPVVESISSQKELEEPTFFEVLTALAFHYFYRSGVQLVVMEAGLGGRLDATNLSKSLLSIITNVSLEHTSILGDTLFEIAREKAGIIKRGQKVLSATKEQVVIEEFDKKCLVMEAQLLLLNQDLFVKALGSSIHGQTFHYRDNYASYQDLFLSLFGRHQLENGALAIGAAHILAQDFHFPVTETALRKGLASVKWPGRIEIISQDPKIIIDGAHNPGGIEALGHFLEKEIEFQDLYLLLGILEDKDANSIFQRILPLARGLILTKSDSQRARNPYELAQVAREYHSQISVIPDFEEALDMAKSLLKKGDLLCICGSLYTMAKARRLLL